MSQRSRTQRNVCRIVCAVGSLWLVASSNGQAPKKPAPRAGEVTGNDVYVRSGPSLNHYTICKLNAGDRITVVGETGEWYEILPPEGTFGLISGDYVDTADDTSGVVNANNVRVRAGSLLNQNKYTVQTLLSKGTEVTILGRNPDGFLRIKPPPETTVWINRNFVQFVPESASKPGQEMTAKPEKDLGESAPADVQATAPAKEASETRASARAESPPRSGARGSLEGGTLFAGLPETQQRRRLKELDAAAGAELKKPTLERRFEELIERYQVIARQNEDEMARRYAEARVGQLTDMATLVETVRHIRRLSEEAASKRRGFLEDRAKIREQLPPIPSGLDVQGELRVSALYPAGSVPRRYRLVDTKGSVPRTIGYVEIPPNANIEVDSFLGRYVGVRASAKRLQTGGVDPVPIYVADELTLLQPGATTTETPGKD